MSNEKKGGRFVRIAADQLVRMKVPPAAKCVKVLVGAQGFEPWTR
jgi:hypothetical protein